MILSKDKLFFILDDFIRDLSALGGIPFHLIFNLIIFFIDFSLAVMLSLNFVLVIFFAYLIRAFYFKKRPNARSYQTILERLDASSFPSIHSFRSFGVMTILSFYFANIWLSLTLFIIAITISSSRVYLKDHDLLDVSFGAFFGIILGYSIYFYKF